MDQLIQDLLTYSRLSRAELELRPVSLATLLKYRGHPGRGAGAGGDAGPGHPGSSSSNRCRPWSGHRGVLSQVFQNLFSNATKFVGPESCPPTVTAERRGAAGARAGDRGGQRHRHRAGAPGADLPRLRAAAPARRLPGTGIGLAIVRKGVERLGGRCGVESSPGAGSRFWVELPAADAAACPTGDYLE